MIIGLSGKIRSGKSTIAEKLENFEKKSVAWKVREVAGMVGGFNPYESKSQEEKSLIVPGWEMSRGMLLQQVGGHMRKLNLDVWVHGLLNNWDGVNYWIIDDVRYPNEVKGIIDCGGVVIRLEGDPSNTRHLDTRDPNHDSETALDNWNFKYVLNTDEMTIDEVVSQIIEIANLVKK